MKSPDTGWYGEEHDQLSLVVDTNPRHIRAPLDDRILIGVNVPWGLSQLLLEIGDDSSVYRVFQDGLPSAVDPVPAAALRAIVERQFRQSLTLQLPVDNRGFAAAYNAFSFFKDVSSCLHFHSTFDETVGWKGRFLWGISHLMNFFWANSTVLREFLFRAGKKGRPRKGQSTSPATSFPQARSRARDV